jgi:hypothetical protein
MGPCQVSAGSSYPWRRGRLTQRFASSSPMNCSLTGSHLRRRPTKRVMLARWQTLTERWLISTSATGFCRRVAESSAFGVAQRQEELPRSTGVVASVRPPSCAFGTPRRVQGSRSVNGRTLPATRQKRQPPRRDLDVRPRWGETPISPLFGQTSRDAIPTQHQFFFLGVDWSWSTTLRTPSTPRAEFKMERLWVSY